MFAFKCFFCSRFYWKHLWLEFVCHDIQRLAQQLICVADLVALLNCIDVAFLLEFDLVIGGYKQIKSPCFCCCNDYKTSFKPKLVKQQHDDVFWSSLFYWFVSYYGYKEVFHKEKIIIIEFNACFEKSMPRHNQPIHF